MFHSTSSALLTLTNNCIAISFPRPRMARIIINALYTKQKSRCASDINVILKVNRVGLVPDKWHVDEVSSDKINKWTDFVASEFLYLILNTRTLNEMEDAHFPVKN